MERQDPKTHPLYGVLMAAIDQAMYGKGERHGGATVPFLEQPIFHYGKMHGRGFLTGQAAKKLEEAASTREGQPFIDECLGAIVYLGAAVIRERQQLALEQDRQRSMFRSPLQDVVQGVLQGAVRQGQNQAGGEARNCASCKHNPIEAGEEPCASCLTVSVGSTQTWPKWARVEG